MRYNTKLKPDVLIERKVDAPAEKPSVVPNLFFTSEGSAIWLGSRIGVGGEGTVYEIQGRADLVAKIYHEPPSPEKAEKLLALARIGAERLFNLSAWPVDVLRDQVPANGGNVAGFVMRRIGQAEEVHALHSPKSRLQKFPEASWAFLIYAAANIARAVWVMHEHGFVVGDVNPKNILVTRKATITLLDCDSFQVTAEGKTYRCEGGFPEYTPPELQGVAFRDVERNKQHDCFGLAVVIFQLLFLGRHPFSGRFSGEGEMPLERAIAESRFAYGSDAGLRQMQPPPGTLAMAAIPKPLGDLFHRAFLSADRPSASEWIQPLETLAKSLKRCAMHSGHHYFAELTECPWCMIEMRARIRLFNFLLPGADQNHGQFRLDEVWREIDEAAQPLALATMPSRIDWGTVQPSEEVKKHFGRPQTRHLVALFLAVAGGLAIGYYGNFCIGTVLLFVAIPVLRKVLDFSADPPSAFVLSNITGASPPPSADPFIRRIEEAKAKAEATFQQMEEQWRKEASAERVQNGLQNLLAQKEAYQNLPRLRDQKLKQLQSNARDTQLEEHLDQFEIADAKISGISSATKASLLSYGIETAADLTPPRLEQVKTMDPAGAKVLRRWRREVAEQFAFDPAKGVSDHARIAVEREIDEMRFRLEHELASGAYYLRRIKLEIEEARQKLKPLVEATAQSLARAEKDYAASQKRLSIAPIVLLLVISFLVGFIIDVNRSGMSSDSDDFYSPPAETNSRPQPVPETFDNSQEKVDAAVKLYDRGMELSEKNNFQDAAIAFEQAVELAPRLAAAHRELGYVLYQMGRYEESIAASQRAIDLGDNYFEPNYHVALAYVAQNNWENAHRYLQVAIKSIPVNGEWREKHIQAYNLWGKTMLKLGLINHEIKVLEQSLRDLPMDSLSRFELGNLYLQVGKHEAAVRQYFLLYPINQDMASVFKRLMIRHGVRTTGRNTRNG